MRVYYEESWLGYVDSITGYVERACRASLCWVGDASVSRKGLYDICERRHIFKTAFEAAYQDFLHTIPDNCSE